MTAQSDNQQYPGTQTAGVPFSIQPEHWQTQHTFAIPQCLIVRRLMQVKELISANYDQHFLV